MNDSQNSGNSLVTGLPVNGKRIQSRTAGWKMHKARFGRSEEFPCTFGMGHPMFSPIQQLCGVFGGVTVLIS
jgi:hypothetical protein